MIEILVSKALATVTANETITSGMTGVKVHFSFSSDWDGYDKTAVFKTDEIAKVVFDTDWENDVCIIPWEVLQKPDYVLSVGIYGYKDNVRTPTIWVEIGNIRSATEPTKDPALHESDAWQGMKDQMKEMVAEGKTSADTATQKADAASASAEAAKNSADTANAAQDAASQIKDTTAEYAEQASASAKQAAESAEAAKKNAEKLDAKGDNLEYDASNSKLYLTSNGKRLGDGVTIQGGSKVSYTDNSAGGQTLTVGD